MFLLRFAMAVIILCGAMLDRAHAEQRSARVSADVTFRCLWWSESQMEGFEPNSPPPKTTEVTIQKWEYTDPVGVPHPDTVDVVIAVTNEGIAPITDLVASIEGQWRIGRLASEAGAVWSKPKLFHTWRALTVGPGQPLVLRVSVDLAARMTELEKKGSWPWTLRAVLTIRAPGIDKPLLKRDVSLPIHPGD